jgi:hypothetical protein
MLASDIILDVRRELLEISGAFWSDLELLRHLNRAERDFVNRTRVLEDTAFLTTTIGVMDYQLPANWVSAKLVLYNAKDKVTDDDAWKRLNATSLEKMGQERPNFLATETVTNLQATPEKYFIWNKRIYLYPAPRDSKDGDLHLFYKSKPIEILDPSQSISVDDSLAEALNAYILWKAWSKSKETSLAEEQKQIYAGYIGEGRRWAKRRSGDQRNKFDIISPTGFGDSQPFGPLT